MFKKVLWLITAVCVLPGVVQQGTTLADGGSNGPYHYQEQQRPIELGTSGGSIDDISLLYCCGGTLGALVEDGLGNQFILSNNHVLALTNSGSQGQPIIHPGLIDQSSPPDQNPPCFQDQTDTVAQLSDFVQIRFRKGRSVPENVVDAAIAQVLPGAVDASGAIIDIGAVSPNTVEAASLLGQAVKKSGRTTGLTKGVVTAIDVSVDVGYSKECGGASNLVARFVNQILIGTPGFSGGGDSGSIIVEDVDVEPRAVGLLFAGNDSVTVANPIDAVLGAFGVAMIGGSVVPPPPPPPEGTGTITGTVSNSADGTPIEAAKVRVDTGQSVKTGPDGGYTISDVPVGEHSVKASAKGFISQSLTVTVEEQQVHQLDFALQPRMKGHKAAVNRASNVKARHSRSLLAVRGVVGHGVGLSQEGKPVIEVYLLEESSEARTRIPKALEGVPVRVKVTGPIEAL